MSNNYDLLTLGELLIDFTENGMTSQGNPLLEANPGGAPCNVLAMFRNLNPDKKCAFIGKIGDDMFGDQLYDAVRSAGICTDFIVKDDSVHTTLAFVRTAEDGDRDFSFYREPGADMMLTRDELPYDALQNTKIFHFGTLSMTHEGVRQATCSAVETARKSGAIISFDPNIRLPLWKGEEGLRKALEWGLGQCDILKIADNEIEFLTGEKDIDAGVRIIRESFPGIKLLNATAGADGSHAYFDDTHVYKPGFRVDHVVDTTGAGDTFCACTLDFVLKNGISSLTEHQLADMLIFANAAASIITTRKGALRSMPKRNEIEKLINSISSYSR